MMRQILALLMIPGLFLCAAVHPGSAASFDCSKASKADERAICADSDLSYQDMKLSSTYNSILPLLKGEERRKFVEGQHEWLGERARCGGDLRCLESRYHRRSEQLESLLASTRKAIQADLFRKTVQCTMCDLSGADLSGMQPSKHADNGLMDCSVNGVARGRFDGARIDHADFVSCRTKYASALNGMSWGRASLKGVDFTGTNLAGNSFEGADLTGANLTEAILFWVDMANAQLRQANLTGAKSPPDAMNGLCSDFTSVDFSEANLEKAELCGSFRGANFSGANLRDARISASLESMDGTEPASTGASASPSDGKIDLSGADLTGATMFGETTLSAKGYAFALLCRTVMPDGTVSNRDCKGQPTR